MEDNMETVLMQSVARLTVENCSLRAEITILKTVFLSYLSKSDSELLESYHAYHEKQFSKLTSQYFSDIPAINDELTREIKEQLGGIL